MFKKIWKIFLKIVLWYFILSISTVIIYRFAPPPVTPLMMLRCMEQSADKNRKVKLFKKWQPLHRISPSLPLAVITAEDQKFEDHFGFDLEAIEKAQQFNERHRGKKVKGASTISQQTAKNVFLWSSRSWIRKGFEVYFTFLIEIFWSKERIMEVYLNVIEMGDGIYGAEAASLTYFNKPASKLSNSESALIAACLPNPLKWSPAKPTSYIRKKQRWILRHISYREIRDSKY